MSQCLNIAVLGAGAWGTAMAISLSKLGHKVALSPRRATQAEAMRLSGENEDYLPGFPLGDGIEVASSIDAALSDTGLVLMASPSYAIRSWCEQIKQMESFASRKRLFVSLAKGLELSTGQTACEIINSELPGQAVGCLSGPTFAGEVAEGRPTAMTLACDNDNAGMAVALQEAASGPSLRIYLSSDLRGVEIGGCLKNVYAIAAGCCQGLRLGDNALAALLTRALAEMPRVGQALGAQTDTFFGLSGFGDLVATCHGQWSRNRTFGEKLAKGESASDMISRQKTAVEGYRTAKAFHEICAANSIDAPILEQVYRILYEDQPASAALSALMSRELRAE